MLKVIIAAADGELLLGPDDLSAHIKARSVQAVEDRIGTQTCVPHVGNIAGEQ